METHTMNLQSKSKLVRAEMLTTRDCNWLGEMGGQENEERRGRD